jgi:Aspartyl protease
VMMFCFSRRSREARSGGVIEASPESAGNESREAQGLPLVHPVEASALIDTGAARTLVAASLIERLGLPVLGDAPEVFGIGLEGRPADCGQR